MCLYCVMLKGAATDVRIVKSPCKLIKKELKPIETETEMSL